MSNRLSVVHRLALAVALAVAARPAMTGQTRSLPGFVVPSFSDLTITTRTSHSVEAARTTTTTLYLKGGRERHESTVEPLTGAPADRHAFILQCDQRRSVLLNLDARLYAVTEFIDVPNLPASATLRPEAQGPVVTTTVDAVDTGERRQVGRHVARRVRTTTVVSPSAGANTVASSRETDGWYIDLPGRGCLDSDNAATTLSVENAKGPRDRHRFELKGTARRGYAIEETSRYTDAHWTFVDTVTLVELSEQPLAASLFDIPADFQPALPTPGGGVDLSKPDSVANRLQVYWNAITSMIARVVPWSGW